MSNSAHSAIQYLIIPLHHGQGINHQSGLDHGIIIDLSSHLCSKGLIAFLQLRQLLNQWIGGIDLQVLLTACRRLPFFPCDWRP